MKKMTLGLALLAGLFVAAPEAASAANFGPAPVVAGSDDGVMLAHYGRHRHARPHRHHRHHGHHHHRLHRHR
ncbi:hypothetical protein [Methylorubrum extorquens]|uniref:Uncharacterized protein n=3 Tax=Methylorubrum extorquens TaxID=408 RepID=B7KQW6_METC4|nr:hypothetical protein [Methylorubrum extorquens]ACK85507.1 conserved hypothetical protein [Methylorubrum extorquens CM4]EHP90743.1 hypothetical protein MetexDRAFT_4377 [Methylorubrum extorquens DSM 13060]WHQ69509.1 hypothetical protein KEC54_24745 [Methylorubrum extorquens]